MKKKKYSTFLFKPAGRNDLAYFSFSEEWVWEIHTLITVLVGVDRFLVLLELWCRVQPSMTTMAMGVIFDMIRFPSRSAEI